MNNNTVLEDIQQFAVSGERLRSLQFSIQNELENYSQASDSSFEVIYAKARLYDRVAKKFLVNSDVDLHAEAIDRFIDCNSQCGEVTLDLTQLEIADASGFILRALENFTYANTEDSQCCLDLDLLVSLWRYGPGSSRGTDATHFAEKIDEVCPTVTDGCLKLASLMRLSNPHTASFDRHYNVGYALSDGSSLSTVPKNETSRRTIATEPLLNMACQLMTGMYVEGALRAVGLDISKQQDVNNHLACVGSESKDLATLDLKSASDLISMTLIKLLWPAQFYDLFLSCRSPFTTFNKTPGIAGTEETIQLHMLSSMGNGFTFPVMTLTLLALVYAAQTSNKSTPYYWDRRTTGVYGDDIICPVSDYVNVVSILTRAGLSVNLDKSFAEGSFRESCGGDYFNGVNITPFYVKSLLHDADIYVAINQLLEWCGTHKVSLLNTLRTLVNMLEYKPLLVPVWSDAFSGIRCNKVSRNYRYLEVDLSEHTVVRRLSRCDHDALSLKMTGGYITSAGHDNYTYVKRGDPSYKVVKARLPQGWCDGSDLSLRDHEKGLWIQSMIDCQTT